MLAGSTVHCGWALHLCTESTKITPHRHKRIALPASKVLMPLTVVCMPCSAARRSSSRAAWRTHCCALPLCPWSWTPDVQWSAAVAGEGYILVLFGCLVFYSVLLSCCQCSGMVTWDRETSCWPERCSFASRDNVWVIFWRSLFHSVFLSVRNWTGMYNIFRDQLSAWTKIESSVPSCKVNHCAVLRRLDLTGA